MHVDDIEILSDRRIGLSVTSESTFSPCIASKKKVSSKSPVSCSPPSLSSIVSIVSITSKISLSIQRSVNICGFETSCEAFDERDCFLVEIGLTLTRESNSTERKC